MKGDVINK